MRKILAATFVTLDGVMQAPGGPDEDPTGGFGFGGWQAALWDDDVGPAIDELLLREPYDLLLGRRTYDIFAAYWPFAPTDPAAEGYEPGMAAIARAFNGARKHVATHRPDSLAWENTAWLGEDAVAAVRRLKEGEGPTLLIQGSSVLIQALLAADLIDEFRPIIYPVVLGGGKRLFGSGTVPRTLRHVRSWVTPKGTIVATYALGGAVETGSFAAETPSEEERARRSALAAEG